MTAKEAIQLIRVNEDLKNAITALDKDKKGLAIQDLKSARAKIATMLDEA